MWALLLGIILKLRIIIKPSLAPFASRSEMACNSVTMPANLHWKVKTPVQMKEWYLMLLLAGITEETKPDTFPNSPGQTAQPREAILTLSTTNENVLSRSLSLQYEGVLSDEYLVNKRHCYHTPYVGRCMWCFESRFFTHKLKSMSKAQPFFFHKDLKPSDASIVAIQHEHGQGSQLGCAVPAVAAVHHHRRLPGLNFVSNTKSPRKNELWNKSFQWNF